MDCDCERGCPLCLTEEELPDGLSFDDIGGDYDDDN
jgi:hypothetical protein